MALDYRTATEDEIRSLAQRLPGLLVGDLMGGTFSDLGAAHGKAEVGHALEAYFGIPKNSRAEADFPGARIELKAVPVLRTGSKARVKERTFVSKIDYMKIVEETWQSAKIRGKLDILFVFYAHLADLPKVSFPILAIDLFVPDDRHNEVFRADWEKVRTMVRHGQAHLLRESDGRVLTPSTKGATGANRSRQPFSDIPAKPRAFALVGPDVRATTAFHLVSSRFASFPAAGVSQLILWLDKNQLALGADDDATLRCSYERPFAQRA